MVTAAEFLGARPGEDGSCSFELGERIHGAFGGVFGGAVAAASLMAARPAAAGRFPLSLHTTFVRGLSTPTCTAAVETVNAGRTVTTIAVDLIDEAGRLAARSTATFVNPEALSAQNHPGRLPPPNPGGEGTTLRMHAPIVDVMEPALLGETLGGHVHRVLIPWEPDPSSAAEAACMAADFCVGVPVVTALDAPVAMPNPDLSLRFVGDEVAAEMISVGRLGRIVGGMVATAVEVWNPDSMLVAIGLSSTVLLGG